MIRLRKAIILYFTLSGIVANAMALGVWYLRPDLVWRVEKRISTVLGKYGLSVSNAAITTDPVSDLAAAFPAWQPEDAKGFPAGQIRVSGDVYTDLQVAAKNLKDGDTLDIGPGTYRKGLIINADGVVVRGHGHVIFDGAAVKGKGAILVQGNTTRIENIECRNIRVSDKNGACIRLEGSNLTLDHCYFHDSEQGVLTGRSPGLVMITNSRFEMLGKGGRAHGIYVGGGDLYIQGSQFLSAINEGHEIKSRAETTVIERSIVASLGGNDSRLIDVSNGGKLVIRGSILEEGPATVNSDVIGFALEKRQHESHSIELTNNIVILDRAGNSRLIHQRKGTPPAQLQSNLIVGSEEINHSGLNVWFATREEAGMEPYPALPPVPK